MSLFPTANQYFPLICKIHMKLLEFCISEEPLVSVIDNCMKKRFDKYWEQVSTVLAMASIFDPRYKVSMVKFYMTKIYGQEVVKINVLDIKHWIHIMYNEYELHYGGNKLVPIGESSVMNTLDSPELDNEKE